MKSVEEISSDLSMIVSGDVYSDILHRTAFSTDSSIYRLVPACVVAPRDSRDISAVVRYARSGQLPVSPRGSGSGLAGESLCSGIVFDMTRYMNRIIGSSDQGRTVICEPGVVLAELNRYLAQFGTKIGPDPSSANRAVVGGCVANNSTGSHSLEYGYIADYVEYLEAVLADGSIVEFTNDFDPNESDDPRVAEIAGKCLELLCDKQQVISDAMPRTRRNRSGYNIADVCHQGRIDMARMLAGSEGTLAIFTKIKLRSVAIPSVKALLELEFDSLEQMARSVPAIVDSGASTCELMGKTVSQMAREAFPKYKDILPDAIATLFIEHNGKDRQEVEEKIQRTDAAVGPLAKSRRTFFDEAQQKRITNARKEAVPLLNRQKGKKHPVPFIEDVSVDNSSLGDYVTAIEEIGRRYGIELAYYGHAGDGELHIRPYLDLGDPSDVQKMLSIANDVFTLAWSLGGSISGEHADGLVRAAFIRRQYGDEFYELLRGVKNIFDPDNLMNPQKIISSDPDVMTSNLRAEKKFISERLASEMLFAKDELEFEIDQCSGCGLCLSRESDLRMCPVYRAMGEELGSSRAKANILKSWVTGDIDEDQFTSKQFRKFLDLCVNCKACSVQCPSGVDISKLMAAARVEYVRRKRLRPAELLLSKNRLLSSAGSMFAPLANMVTRMKVFGWLLEKITGMDRRRMMPAFGKGTFLKAGREYLSRSEPIAEPIDKVAYFVDTFANFNDPELGLAVLEVLRHNDIEVILPDQLPSPLPAIVYGDVKDARKDLTYSVEHLAEAVRRGNKVVCSEPSAALCLKEELRHFVDSDDARSVSENTFELMEYLLGMFEQGRLKPASAKIEKDFAYHCPCHLFAIGGGQASIELLNKLCGLKVEDLKAGCCGLAGTFGMQKKNYDLSGEISKDLKQKLEKSPTKEVLTECAACGMQIEHISDAQVTHPIKILASCYGLR